MCIPIAAAALWQVYIWHWTPRYGKQHNKQEANRICQAMRLLALQKDKVAHLFEHLAYEEVRVILAATHLALREAGIEGYLRAA
eukprot:CAMPEP_0204585458 /NCGR_PEP_ID=MMETSP0661-20131031/46935_1 /ASSEMBLY_ACC=CAM_ASM_000606 /TAXON_ID=109239 /ORGANISM="Alexandrium margalefi, Strain AMGDE01CS-322" /LENGTH=83 /DNA_ID=CAMNT_0051595015 /DNA_START=38 /DNA_END=286 /DNA_ORIENTATION=+